MLFEKGPESSIVREQGELVASELHSTICHNLNVGLVVVNRENRVLIWNRFMEIQTGYKSDTVKNRSLFEIFPELPVKWMQKKIQSVLILNNNSYSSWKDRPHVFPFKHNRPITGVGEFMYQDCSFIPLRNEHGRPESVCIAIFDMTDVGIYHDKLKEASDVIITLEQIASHDTLTGAFNRSYLDTRLEEEVALSETSKSELSVLMLDIDHFKRVNDTYGHQAGDETLRVFALTISDSVRTGDIVCRYGGEEFTVLLPGTPSNGACLVAERIRQAVENVAVTFGGIQINVTVSIGVSAKSETSVSAADLLHDADKALYYAKSHGRNQVHVAP